MNYSVGLFGLVVNQKQNLCSRFLNEFFYYGRTVTAYKIVDQDSDLLVLEKIKYTSSFSTALKVSLLFTGIIPLIALLYKLVQFVRFSFLSIIILDCSVPSSSSTPEPLDVSRLLGASSTVPVQAVLPRAETLRLESRLQEKFNEICRWIDGLGFPESRNLSDQHSSDNNYYASDLKRDFQRFVEQKISVIRRASEKNREKLLEKALREIEILQHQLKIHLGLEKGVDGAKCIGIPNYTGSNCHYNSALQIMVHTQYLDYPLFRPFEDPPKEPCYNLEFLKEPTIQQPIPLIEKESAKQKKEEYQVQLRNYETAWRNYRGEVTKKNYYEDELKFYEERKRIRDLLCEIVLNMRSDNPKPPTRQQMAQLAKGEGNVDSNFREISSSLGIPLKYSFQLENLPKQAAEGFSWGSPDQIPMVVAGTGFHLWAYIIHRDRQVTELNDHRVRRLNVGGMLSCVYAQQGVGTRGNLSILRRECDPKS